MSPADLFGNEYDNFIEGTSDDDVIDAGRGDDTVSAGPGNDAILPNPGNDLFRGESGNDTIDGGSDNDTLHGGPGNDELIGSSGHDLAYGGSGDDGLFGGSGNDTLSGGEGHDLLRGQDGADDLTGGDGDDTLDGGQGDDLLDGAFGNDSIDAGDGADTVDGSRGNDTIHGGAGDDLIAGAPGDDEIHGDAGNDTLEGQSDNDSLYGGDGADSLTGSSGNDLLDGGADSDTLRAGEGDDTVLGGVGDDLIDASLGNDSVDAGDGADTVDGSDGNDTIHGGAGDDSIHGSPGDDSINGGPGNDWLEGGSDNDTLRGEDGDDTLSGYNGDDLLDGGVGSDTLWGGSGDDTLNGGDGDDEVWGGPGADRLSGGAGNDTITDGTGFDTIDGGDGIDLFQRDYGTADFVPVVDLALGRIHAQSEPDDFEIITGVENVTLPGGQNAIVTGTGGANRLVTGAGDDTVAGGGGNDTILTGDGTDTVVIGAVFEDVTVQRLGSDLQIMQASGTTLVSGAELFAFADRTLTADQLFAEAPTDEGAVDAGGDGSASGDLSGQYAVGDAPTYTPQAATAGDYGNLALEANGHWTYTLDPAAAQALDEGESATDSFPVSGTAADGAPVTDRVTITVTGAEDAAVVTGTFTGAVTEGDPGDLATAGGTLAITDPDDADTPGFADLPATAGDNGFGSFTLTDGTWTYTLDQSAVQQLDAGDTTTDSTTFTASDGSTQQVVVTITGTDDPSVVSGVFEGSVSAEAADEMQVAAGDEIRVNSASGTAQRDPAVATLADGGFVVVWSAANDAADGDQEGIKAQLFDAEGLPVGAEFLVNSATADRQVSPAVGALADGGFVVAWHTLDFSQDGDQGALKAQRFSPDGIAVGAEFLVNTETRGNPTGQTVAGLSDGGFVVAWAGSHTVGASSGQTVLAQVYRNTGQPAGPELTLPETTFGNAEPFLLPLEGGGFLAAWRMLQNDDAGSDYQIRGRFLDGDGTAVGGEFTLNAEGIGRRHGVEIAQLDTGGFVAAWETRNGLNPDDDTDITARIFDETGSPIGAEFTVLDETSGRQQRPSVVALGDGRFAVSWGDYALDRNGSDAVLRGRVFDMATGAAFPVAESFVLDATSEGFQYPPSLTAHGSNGFFATWWGDDAETPAGQNGIFARTFTLESGLDLVTATATGTLTISDADADDQPVFADVAATVGDEGFGTFTLTDGQWTYRLDAEAAGGIDPDEGAADQITFTASDGTRQSIVISIDGGALVPDIFGPTEGSVTEDGSQSASGSLSIEGGGAFTAQRVVTDLGTFVLTEAGGWTYTLDNAAAQRLAEGQTMTERFEAAGIGTLGEATATSIAITITGTDDAPEITGSAAGAVTEDTVPDTSGTLTATDVDDGEEPVFTAQAATPGTYGTFALGADGSWSYALDPSASQGLAGGEIVTESFAVEATSAGGAPATESVVITIAGTEDAPEVTGTLAATLTEETEASATGALVASDADTGDVPVVTPQTTKGSYGSLDLRANGRWTYTLDPDATARLPANAEVQDSFTVRATTADGEATEETLTVTVIADAIAPDLAGDLSGTVQEDGTAVAVGQLEGPVGDPITFAAQTDVEGRYGRFALTEDGLWTYALDNALAQGLGGDDSTTETFAVSAENAEGEPTTGTVTVTVAGVEDAPVIGGALAASLTEDAGPATGRVLVSDADTGDDPVIVAGMQDGTYGRFVVTETGDWAYTPNAAAQGLAGGEDVTERFTVTATTEDGEVGTAEVVISLGGVEDVPIVTGLGSGAVAEDGALTAEGQLTVADADAGDTPLFEVASLSGAFGRLVIGEDGGWTYSLDNALAQALPGGASVTETFEVFAVTADGERVGSEVRITVEGQEDPTRILGPVTGTVAEDGLAEASGQLAVADPDTEIDGAGWSFTPRDGIEGSHGIFAIDASGAWTYRLDPVRAQGLSGDEVIEETFAITAEGADAAQLREEIVVSVTGAEDAPVTGGSTLGFVTRDSDGTLTRRLTGQDADRADAPAFVAQATTEGDYGSFTLHANGTWTYTVDERAVGLAPATSATETFTAELTTQDGERVTQAVSVVVEGRAPVPYALQGTDALVNSEGTGPQDSPSIAALAGGGYVVAWQSGEGPRPVIAAQVYDASGAALGGEITVNTSGFRAANAPVVEGTEDGGFVVDWVAYQTFGNNGIERQAFSVTEDGAVAVGGPTFRLGASESAAVPSLAALSGGGFASVWSTYGGQSRSAEVTVQVLDATGTPRGPEVSLTGGGDWNHDMMPSVASLPDGGFVVAWQTVDGGDFQIRTQFFDASGSAQSDPVDIQEAAVGNRTSPSVTSLGDGRSVVAWHGDGPDADEAEGNIKARIIDANGQPLGAEFTINSDPAGDQGDPVVTATGDGGFLVAWRSDDPSTDGEGQAIVARFFDGAGAAIGEDFVVNASATGDQNDPAVAMLADGRVVVTWVTGDPAADGDRTAVLSRVIAPDTDASLDASDATLSAQEDTPLTGNLVDLVTAPDDVELDFRVDGAGNGQVTLREDGGFDYTPATDFFGTDSFRYEVTDDQGNVAFGMVTLTVAPDPDAPVLSGLPEVIAVTEDVARELDLSVLTIDNIAAETIVLELAVDQGVLTVGPDDSGSEVEIDRPDETRLRLAGRPTELASVLEGLVVTYQAPPDRSGQGIASLTVIVRDAANPDTSARTVVPFDVTSVEDAPRSIFLEAASVAENTPGGSLVSRVLVGDPDEGDVHSFELLDDAGGRFVLVGDALHVADRAVLDYESETAHSVTLRVTDASGLTLEDVLTVSVQDLADPVPDADTVEAVGEDAETVVLEVGNTVVRGRLGDFAGDTIRGLDTEDSLVIMDAEIERGAVQFEAATGLLSIDIDGDGVADQSLTLEGDFAGGDVMAVTRGGQTTLSFETFLPALGEGEQVDTGAVNGINNQEFLTGDGTTDFEVSISALASGARYDNSLGVYEVDESGAIVDVRLLFGSTKSAGDGAVALVDGVEAGHKLGLFIVQDGADWAAGLSEEDSFAFVDRDGAAGTLEGGPLSLQVDGVDARQTVFHSMAAGLNPDAVQHALSGVASGGQSITVGFEDLTGGGDRDYQDVVFDVLAIETVI